MRECLKKYRAEDFSIVEIFSKFNSSESTYAYCSSWMPHLTTSLTAFPTIILTSILSRYTFDLCITLSRWIASR